VSGRRLLYAAAEKLAAFGGLALVGVVAVTLVSVIGGRFGRPLLGDTEIVELLCGIAVASFMPWCQMRGANVIVDFFTARAPQRVRDFLDAVAYALFAVIVAVLTERMIEGAWTQYERGRVSMFLQLPQWWGYALAAAACVLWTAVCGFTAWERLRAFRGGRAR
jgi:TRAP-type C4-dicarboxylate transport system permease small subunit